MIEHRRDKRFNEENRVIIEHPKNQNLNGQWTINAFTRDISLGGARILTDKPFPVRSDITMTMYLSRSKQIARTHAQIKWIKTIDDGLYEMGVEFMHEIPSCLITLINHLYRKDQAISTCVQA